MPCPQPLALPGGPACPSAPDQSLLHPPHRMFVSPVPLCAPHLAVLQAQAGRASVRLPAGRYWLEARIWAGRKCGTQHLGPCWGVPGPGKNPPHPGWEPGHKGTPQIHRLWGICPQPSPHPTLQSFCPCPRSPALGHAVTSSLAYMAPMTGPPSHACCAGGGYLSQGPLAALGKASSRAPARLPARPAPPVTPLPRHAQEAVCRAGWF